MLKSYYEIQITLTNKIPCGTPQIPMKIIYKLYGIFNM